VAEKRTGVAYIEYRDRTPNLLREPLDSALIILFVKEPLEHPSLTYNGNATLDAFQHARHVKMVKP
jgi:hypothetical protein